MTRKILAKATHSNAAAARSIKIGLSCCCKCQVKRPSEATGIEIKYLVAELLIDDLKVVEEAEQEIVKCVF